MDVKLSHTFVTVDDHDAALAFYRDVLGLRVTNDVSFENMRWLSLSPPGQPDVEIVITTPADSPQNSAEDRRVLSDLLAKGSLNGLIFRTADCDATFEQVRASGAEVLQEPMDQAYGVRDCAVRDPAGNMVRFSQPRNAG
jgi:catechol 2,3-dioxygenase-like lactoylglutathione lyase family enzyme